MSTAEAMRQYVARLTELNLGWDANQIYRIRYGVRPSTLADARSTEVSLLTNLSLLTSKF